MLKRLVSLIFCSWTIRTVAAYPLYVQFEYQPGIEYDVYSNSSFIRVMSDVDTPMYLYLPPECNGNTIRAKKIPPRIMMEITCDDDQSFNRVMVI